MGQKGCQTGVWPVRGLNIFSPCDEACRAWVQGASVNAMTMQPLCLASRPAMSDLPCCTLQMQSQAVLVHGCAQRFSILIFEESWAQTRHDSRHQAAPPRPRTRRLCMLGSGLRPGTGCVDVYDKQISVVLCGPKRIKLWRCRLATREV